MAEFITPTSPPVEARDAIEWNEIRIETLGFKQSKLGGAGVQSFNFRFYNKDLGDAPASFDVKLDDELSLEELMNIDGIPQAFAAITKAGIELALRKGRLRPKE